MEESLFNEQLIAIQFCRTDASKVIQYCLAECRPLIKRLVILCKVKVVAKLSSQLFAGEKLHIFQLQAKTMFGIDVALNKTICWPNVVERQSLRVCLHFQRLQPVARNPHSRFKNPRPFRRHSQNCAVKGQMKVILVCCSSTKNFVGLCCEFAW